MGKHWNLYLTDERIVALGPDVSAAIYAYADWLLAGNQKVEDVANGRTRKPKVVVREFSEQPAEFVVRPKSGRWTCQAKTGVGMCGQTNFGDRCSLCRAERP